MGKKAKEHRAKVAKRNAKIKQKKSGMQKAFDLLLQEQLKKLKDDEMKIEVQGNDINYEVVEHKTIDHAFKFTPNEEESAKINKEFQGNVSFKEENPEFLSVNQISVNEFEEMVGEESPVEDQISELEK